MVTVRADQPGGNSQCAGAAQSTWEAGGCLYPDSAGVGRDFVRLCFGAERSPGGAAIPAIPRVQPCFHLVANWQNFSAGASPVTFRCSNLHVACSCAQPAKEQQCVWGEMDGLGHKYPPL